MAISDITQYNRSVIRGRRIVVKGLTAIVAVVGLTLPGAALAAPQSYVPRHHHRCRAGYVRRVVRVRRHRNGRVVKVRVAECVRRTQHPTVTHGAVSYAAQVDPSYTQAKSNPLAVTYAYSADATTTVNGQTTDLAQTGQLPAGVLNLYSATSPGQPAGLVCSMNVGGPATGGNCLVNYRDTASYPVTVEYIPNGSTAPVTQTDLEAIAPYSTSTVESVAMVGSSCGSPTPNGPNQTTYECAYTVSASTTDQNGTALGQPLTLTFSDGHGDDLTFTEPAGQGSCTVLIQDTTYPGGETTASTSPYSSSSITSHDCSGGGTVSGRSVPSWTVVASFAGTPGYTPSSSATQTITPPW